jgi:hypothetical protein
MTHDSLCKVSQMPERLVGIDPQYENFICQCDLINSVVEREKTRAVRAVWDVAMRITAGSALALVDPRDVEKEIRG